jgi:hypothetical protein
MIDEDCSVGGRHLTARLGKGESGDLGIRKVSTWGRVKKGYRWRVIKGWMKRRVKARVGRSPRYKT